MNKRFSCALVCLVAVFCLSVGQAFAQVNTADVLGTVTDAGGAVIPNVKVTIVNTATNDTRTATTGSTGDYIFNLVPSGSYTITAEAPSFKKASIALNVVSGDRARANVQLQVGDVTQTVEVAALSPALQTDSATLSTVVAAQSVQDLPLNGRNYVTLVQSTVGVVPGPSNGILSGTRPDERRQTASASANGQNEVFNNQLIDGMDNNEREHSTILMRPSIDMIQEVKVDTNTYPAEVGRAGGAVVNLLTKSGSNGLHGNLYEYLRNDKLNANEFFANRSGVPRPKYRQNQYGGSLGGAIKKDKTFFFGDYEALRIVQGVPTGLLSTPTAFELANPGNFSDQPGGHVFTANQLDPVALKYWKLWPKPNTGLPNAIQNNYSANVNKTYNSTTYDARVDHRFSDRDSMFGRFSYNPTFNSQPALFPDVTVDGLKVNAGGGIFPGASNANSHGYMADFVHIISPTMVLEVKASFIRLHLYTVSPNIGTNASAKFGMPNTDLDDQISGLATVQLTGFVGVGSGVTLGDDRFVPILDINNVFQEQGSLTWTRGAHNIKFGAGLIRRQLNYYQNTQGMGYFQFTQTPLANLENLIQGKPDQIQRQVNQKRQYLRVWEPSFFVQDDWHVKPWLALNIGMRWSHFSPLTAAQGQRSNFDPELAKKCTPTSCNPFQISGAAGVKSYWTNFEPRFGFAATVRKGLVVRGGFGMSRFVQDFGSGAVNLLNIPFIAQTINCQTSATSQVPCPAGSGLLRQGAPVVTIPALNNQLPGVMGAKATEYPQAYIMQWNLTVQKQFGSNVVSAGYVGQVGRHLQYAPNINVPAPSPAGPFRPLVYSGVLPNATVINYFTATGASEYHAAQFSFERRYAKGLTVNANYVFNRNLTNISDGGTTGAATVGGILPYDRSYDWGNSDIGVKHRFSYRFNYELPFGKSGSRMRQLAIGGWQANLLAFIQSGIPFTVLDSKTPVPSHVSSLVTTDRPNLVAGAQFYPSKQTYDNWLNLNAFALQPVGVVGNEGRTMFYGPHQRSMDFSLFKDFQLRERMKLQFRAEVYNITNSENFGQPNLTITAWSSANAGATPLTNGQFGQITSSNQALNPRQYQFALKLIF